MSSYGFNNGRRGNGRGWDQGGWGQFPNNSRGWGGPPAGGGWGGPQPRQFQFSIGEKVLHVASGVELSVIGYGREQLECRKPDLSSEWFYEHELAPLDGGGMPPQQ